MEKIDTEKLREFNEKLTKLSSNYEETWYLLKRIMNEMESDLDFDMPEVYQEMQEAYQKLEKIMEFLNSLKYLMKAEPDHYEIMMERHIDAIAKLSEYASGYKANFDVLQKETRLRPARVTYTNTGAIKASLERKMGGLEVLKNE